MSKSRAVVILGLAGAIGVGGGIAAASIPAPGGTIHACYVNANLLNGTLSWSTRYGRARSSRSRTPNGRRQSFRPELGEPADFVAAHPIPA